MTAAYPPAEHMLRDLRFSFEHDTEGRASRAWLPVVDELCTDYGGARAGALATLVDVIGGGLAAAAAAPDWIATADLTLHLVRAAPPGSVVEANARVLRAGRTTVVIEVDLSDDIDRVLGAATMSFAVLPRRDHNPDMSGVRDDGPSSMAVESSRLREPFLDALGVSVLDATTGSIEVPVTDWSRNSMGALQGGLVATIADASAEIALRAATGSALVVSDLQVSFLGFGRTGPVHARADVLHACPEFGSARVEIIDSGADARLMTLASASATRELVA
jgi:uncharacterized protein (TIGR00369 family)